MKSESEVAESRLTLSNPVDCGLPGSSVHGIFQARVLEWGAIAFSGASLSSPQNCEGKVLIHTLSFSPTGEITDGKDLSWL